MSTFSEERLHQAIKDLDVAWLFGTAIQSFNAGDPHAAIRVQSIAYMLCPDSPEILINLALMYHSTGQDKEAIQYFSQARVFSPDDPEIVRSLSALLEAQSEREAIRTLCTLFLSKHPENFQIRTLLDQVKTIEQTTPPMETLPKTKEGGNCGL